MQYGRKKIGPKFGDRLGRLAHVAITAGNKRDYNGYRQAVEEIYQMLDTVAQEADFEQHFTLSEPTRTPEVAAASEPDPQSESASEEVFRDVRRDVEDGGGAARTEGEHGGNAPGRGNKTGKIKTRK